MLCGIEIEEKISEEKAEWIAKCFDLHLKTSYLTKNEKSISNKPNSYLRDGKFRSLIIEVRKKQETYTLTIRGSLHKFYHGNNCGEFLGGEVIDAIASLCNRFQIFPGSAMIKNVEVGVNIPVWFQDVYPYLKSNLIQHRKVCVEEPSELKRKGFHFKHEDYLIKLYHKGDCLLRYEIRFTSIKKLRDSFGIITLKDISSDTINGLVDSLIAEWKEIIMRDGLNIYNEKNRTDGLTERDRNRLLEFSSSIYQQSYRDELKDSLSEIKKNSLRQKSFRLRIQCMKIILAFGNGDHAQLHSFITEISDRFKNSWSEHHIKHNVTDSAINKKRENVTVGITKENRNNTTNTMSSTKVKSKRQEAIEKRQEVEKQRQSFLHLLSLTERKINGKGHIARIIN